MKVYVVERHFRETLVKPFAATLLELFETREAGLKFCKQFIKNSKENSSKLGVHITITPEDGKDIVCNVHVASFEFLRGYWKEVRK